MAGKTLLDRIVRLEQHTHASSGERDQAAKEFMGKMLDLANRLHEDDVHISEEERIRTMSPAGHVAWCIRFTGTADIRAIMAKHGRSMPAGIEVHHG